MLALIEISFINFNKSSRYLFLFLLSQFTHHQRINDLPSRQVVHKQFIEYVREMEKKLSDEEEASEAEIERMEKELNDTKAGMAEELEELQRTVHKKRPPTQRSNFNGLEIPCSLSPVAYC